MLVGFQSIHDLFFLIARLLASGSHIRQPGRGRLISQPQHSCKIISGNKSQRFYFFGSTLTDKHTLWHLSPLYYVLLYYPLNLDSLKQVFIISLFLWVRNLGQLSYMPLVRVLLRAEIKELAGVAVLSRFELEELKLAVDSKPLHLAVGKFQVFTGCWP